MKHQEAQQQWWTALKGWMDSDQGRADYLFVYDPKLGRLERCFEKDAPTEQVDEASIRRRKRAVLVCCGRRILSPS